MFVYLWGVEAQNWTINLINFLSFFEFYIFCIFLPHVTFQPCLKTCQKQVKIVDAHRAKLQTLRLQHRLMLLRRLCAHDF
jgi:hypothetical protein